MMIKKYIDLIIFLTYTGVLLFSGGCEKSPVEEPVAESRLLLHFSPAQLNNAVSAEELAAEARLFAFQQSAPNLFNREIYPFARIGSKLDAWIQTGSWELVLVSPSGATLSMPDINQPISGQRMYQYTPRTTGGVSESAPELFYNRITNLPQVEPDGEYAVSTTLARNVAMVKIIFEKEAGIDPAAQHTLKLHNVPGALTWAGGLYPDRNNPTVLGTPLEGVLTFSPLAGDPGFSKSNEVIFIIPAHRGSDFWLADGITLNPAPTDTTTHKMGLSVNLRYADGSTFSVSNKEIPVVPRCNAITEIKLKINRAEIIEITTNTKPWGQETVDGDLKVPFLNISTTEVSLLPGEKFRVYFWTNQKTNLLVEAQGRLDDPINGASFSVSDLFENLENKPDNLNFLFDPVTGSGHFDITNIQTVPGATRYYLYFNANGVRRAIAIAILP